MSRPRLQPACPAPAANALPLTRVAAARIARYRDGSAWDRRLLAREIAGTLDDAQAEALFWRVKRWFEREAER